MDEWQTTPIENALFYLIVFASLALVPAIFSWWLIAQSVNRRMRKSGRKLIAGRWHFLRFGPTAPLISAAAFLCGLVPSIIALRSDLISPTVMIPLFILTGFGLVALMMSMVLWSYSNAPTRAKPDSEKSIGGDDVSATEASRREN